MNNLLEVNLVSKRFPGFFLDNVSFAVPQGYIMGLVGPNGAGKTTLINLILNMLKLEGGDIRVFGLDSRQCEVHIKEDLGVIFDRLFFVGDWTARGTERAISDFYPNWDSVRFRTLIKEFELPTNKKLKDFSRGMQVKLMLAVALAHNARLLILDEPTSGLDAPTRDQLSEILQEYIEDGEKSVLFSTHISSDLERVADYITFINDGRLAFTGPLQDLLENHRLIKGGMDDLTETLKGKLIGVRKSSFGFEGLIRTEDSVEFKPLTVEKASLDDIVIFTSRGKVGVA